MSIEQQIVVRGEAERQAPADIAGLSIAVQVNDAKQDQAFAKASAIAAAVDVVLDERAAALGTRQAAVVVVRPTVRWDNGEEQRTGWQARRTTSLDITDLTLVTPLLAELVAAGGIVHGPFWRLRPDHPILGEARTAAAADARLRADAFAAGLGVQVGRVEWIAEPGLRLPGELDGPGARGGVGMLKEQAMDASGIEVAPADLTVVASIEVGFSIER